MAQIQSLAQEFPFTANAAMKERKKKKKKKKPMIMLMKQAQAENVKLMLLFFSPFLAAPTAYGSSWARDQIQATTYAIAAAMPDP